MIAETNTTPAVVISPDRPTRRTPVYSEDYAGHLRQMLREDRERLVGKYTVKLATAHHAIRQALRSLEYGDVDRAVRELRRGGALSTEELQET